MATTDTLLRPEIRIAHVAVVVVPRLEAQAAPDQPSSRISALMERHDELVYTIQPTNLLYADTSPRGTVFGQCLVEAVSADSNNLCRAWRNDMKTAALILALSLAGGTLVAQKDAVRSLLSKDLAAAPGKEVLMLSVEYSPGESSPPHTHQAQAMVYVLEGSIEMQVKGGAPVTLSPGQTWYEGPDDVHVVSRNASKSAPAKYLVFMVKDKGAPILTPVK